MFLFLESQPYFGQNCLQGEKERNEGHCCKISIPLPNPSFPESNDQEVTFLNEENEMNTNLLLQSIIVPQTGGEIIKTILQSSLSYF